jgi:hypothetical protein
LGYCVLILFLCICVTCTSVLLVPQLQLYCHDRKWPFHLHRVAGAGPNGVYQEEALYHTYITFSLEVCNALVRGDIIPGLKVDTEKFRLTYPSFDQVLQEDDDDEEYDDKDDAEDDEECDDDDDAEDDDHDDEDDPSTSPTICPTPTSVGKRSTQPDQASNVKRPCLQASSAAKRPWCQASPAAGSSTSPTICATPTSVGIGKKRGPPPQPPPVKRASSHRDISSFFPPGPK